MTQAATATATKADDIVIPGRTVAVLPADLQIDFEGFHRSHYVCRLPKGATPEALRDPTIWSEVQKKRRPPLKKFDTISAIAFDETWLAECLCTSATNEAVTLQVVKLTKIESRIPDLPQTAEHRIDWTGKGFQIIRKSDGVPVSHGVQDLGTAVRELQRQAPRKS